MNRNILNQAFITMGYRQMSSYNIGNIYGKPVGFGIVIAKINQNHKEIIFKTLCRSVQGETLAWDSKKINIDYTDPKVGYETLDGKDLYERYINMIAYAEYECHTDKIIYSGGYRGGKGPFAFSSRNDIMSMINL